MTRKSRSSSGADLRSKPSSTTPTPLFPPRFRAPRELRIVSSKTVRSPTGQRERVPHISISGKWLEDRGFPAGTRFVLLADTPNQIVLALVDLE